MSDELKRGDWVRVKPEYDIPFAPPGGTVGRVDYVDRAGVVVWVPIGGADVDEHSQSVVYYPYELEPTEP